eukprot:scpid107499/ scgid31386/ 
MARLDWVSVSRALAVIAASMTMAVTALAGPSRGSAVETPTVRGSMTKCPFEMEEVAEDEQKEDKKKEEEKAENRDDKKEEEMEEVAEDEQKEDKKKEEEKAENRDDKKEE